MKAWPLWVAVCVLAACAREAPPADSNASGLTGTLDLTADASKLEVSVPAGSDAPGYLQLQESVAWNPGDPRQRRWRSRTMHGTTGAGFLSRGGKPCLAISAGDAGADADLRTLVRVKPNTDYRLEASLWMTGHESIDARVAGTVYIGEFDYLLADGQDRNDPLRWHTSGPRFTGTSDRWQRFSYDFRTRPATRMLRLAASLGNWGRARGELCLTDVRLTEVRPVSAQILPAVVGDETRRALLATPRSELRLDVTLPEQAVLSFGAGLDESGRELEGDGVLFEVEVEHGGRTANLYSQQIRRDADAWEDVRVPLDAFAGERVTLLLRTLPSPRGKTQDFTGDTAFWANPRIERDTGREKSARQAQPDVFLITVDTLRPDHLGSYGYSRGTSPAIDALASDGVLFENAFTTVPRTGPSVASLLTGRYPAAHGVHSMLDSLNGANLTLAEVLHSAGYRTAAQVTLNLPWRKSFDQGFERYDDRTSDHIARGEDLAQHATEWLERRRDEPIFYWLHLWDPHFIYDAPKPWKSLFDPGFDGVFDLYQQVRRKQRTWGQVFFENDLTPRQVEHAIARYDGEIRYADRVIEGFLETLKSLDLYDDAVIVFTSDHGESLGEHGYYFEHGEYLYDATLRIPLIVKLPGGREAGRRQATPASILDVVPTVLAAAGVRDPATRGGEDLTAQLEEDRSRRTLFAQSGHNFFSENPRREVDGRAGYWTSIREGRFKLIRIPTRLGAEYELYDIESDPSENRNLYLPEEAQSQRLRTALDAWRDRLLESDGAEATTAIDPREIERLRALGYIN